MYSKFGTAIFSTPPGFSLEAQCLITSGTCKREVLQHVAGADHVDGLVGDRRRQRIDFGAVVAAHRHEAGRRYVLRAQIELEHAVCLCGKVLSRQGDRHPPPLVSA
jgi:hypothetical protein